MLGLRGVFKRFGGVEALRGVTFAADTGNTTALLGPSGCGKSTILRLLIGLDAPDRGDVLRGGTPVTIDQLRRLTPRPGYVIQEGGLFPHLRAGDNVSLMARRAGWDRARVQRRLDELSALVRLPRSALGRYPAELSGGQRQRVGLMRALMLDPDLLLMDEPLGALDPLVRADLQDDLRAIFQHLRKTVVLVTHDLSEAAYLAHRIVLMRDGRIVQQGPPADLVERPADEFVRRFVSAQRGHFEALAGGAPA